jgi:membrane protease YdiL (CAAX protease family)
MAAILLAATWFLRQAGQRWADVGLRRPTRLWRLPLQVVAGYVGVVAGVVLAAGVLLPALGVERNGFHGLESIRGDLGAYLYWGLLVSWLPAAFGEEMLARGFVLDRLNALLGPGPMAAWLAVLGQAVLFGAAHFYQGLDGMLLSGLTGLSLGALFLACGRNLWPCIVVHGLIDMGSFTALYLGVAGG